MAAMNDGEILEMSELPGRHVAVNYLDPQRGRRHQMTLTPECLHHPDGGGSEAVPRRLQDPATAPPQQKDVVLQQNEERCSRVVEL